MALPNILDPVAPSSRKIDLVFGLPENPKHAILDFDFSALPSWLDIAKLGVKIVALDDEGNAVDQAADLLIEINAAPSLPQMYNMETLGARLRAEIYGRDEVQEWHKYVGSIPLQLVEGTTKIKLVPVITNKDRPADGFSFNFSIS